MRSRLHSSLGIAPKKQPIIMEKHCYMRLWLEWRRTLLGQKISTFLLKNTVCTMRKESHNGLFVQLITLGQLGTQLMGGRDAASPGYMYTHLSPIARLLFPEVDDMVTNFLFTGFEKHEQHDSIHYSIQLLTHKEEDGQLIDEPDFYCIVIPLVLINRCQGIGTKPKK
jgi:hypothetical protein